MGTIPRQNHFNDTHSDDVGRNRRIGIAGGKRDEALRELLRAVVSVQCLHTSESLSGVWR